MNMRILFADRQQEGGQSVRTPMHILLADDHQLGRQGMRTLLDRDADLKVVGEAGEGHTAVRLAREMAPDLVIVDLSLPDLNGIEGVRRILAASPRVKVIALSIYADRRFVVNVLKAGASGYLLKDRAFDELPGAIRTVMDNKTYISPGVSDIVVQDYMLALRDSEARFRTIFEGSTMGIVLVDRDGRIVESNPALQAMLGYSQGELSQKIFTEFIPPTDAEGCRQLFKELVERKRESYQVEKQYVRKDGLKAWGRLTVSPFQGAGGDHQFALVMVEDITEQKQAETEIRTYQEQLRSLASELSLTEERERRRLATELHDHVGQILALAQIKLGALKESVSSSNLAAAMDEVRQLIEQTIRYTRSLTFELSPPILYDLGFEAAVEWLAELIQDRQGIRIEVISDRSPKPLEDEIRVLLFQAVRELLVNVARHGQAKHVKVTIAREGHDLLIRVEDDGVWLGRSPGTPLDRLQSLGLFGIRERLKYLGGHLEEESGPDRGNRVTLVVPLKY